MTNARGDSPAWSVLLPDDTIRLPRRGHGPKRFRRMVRLRGSSSATDVLHSYVTYPRDKPVVIASKDAVVLRYVATSVLSVPPGGGRILSVVFTSGLRLLRLPIMWTFATVFRAAGTVLVGPA